MRKCKYVLIYKTYMRNNFFNKVVCLIRVPCIAFK